MIRISPAILAEFENDLFRLYALLNDCQSNHQKDELWFIGKLTTRLYAYVYVLDARCGQISSDELETINDLKIELLCEYVEAVQPTKGWNADIWDRLALIESEDKAGVTERKLH